MKNAFLEYTINYNEADEPYIDYLTSCLNANIEDIKRFFDIKKLSYPITINLWSDKVKYMENMENNYNQCNNYEINLLTGDLNAMYIAMLRQFTNICFYQTYNQGKMLKWLSMGITLLLSNACAE